MLKRYTDDYEAVMYEAEKYKSQLIAAISERELYVGNAPELDKPYALCIAMSAMLDYLYNYAKTDTELNRRKAETVLLHLKKLTHSKPC